jgi:hypothetical protein
MSAIFHSPPGTNKIAYASWERHRERYLLDRGIGVTGVDRGSRRLGLSNSNEAYPIPGQLVGLRCSSSAGVRESDARLVWPRIYRTGTSFSYPRINGTESSSALLDSGGRASSSRRRGHLLESLEVSQRILRRAEQASRKNRAAILMYLLRHAATELDNPPPRVGVGSRSEESPDLLCWNRSFWAALKFGAKGTDGSANVVQSLVRVQSLA